LKERLGVLGVLGMGRCIREYSDVLSLDIVPSESFTWLELPALLGTSLVEKKLANVRQAMYLLDTYRPGIVRRAFLRMAL
jgi:hypothetical protein